MEASGPRYNARFALWRSVIFYTPLGILSGLLLTYLIIERLRGGLYSSLILLLIVLVMFIFASWQALDAIRDLLTQPMTTTGGVRRKWSRPLFLFLGRSFYIQVAKYVFSIDQLDWVGLKLGDTVTVVHYPHTWTVLDIQRAPQTSSSGHQTTGDR